VRQTACATHRARESKKGLHGEPLKNPRDYFHVWLNSSGIGPDVIDVVAIGGSIEPLPGQPYTLPADQWPKYRYLLHLDGIGCRCGRARLRCADNAAPAACLPAYLPPCTRAQLRMPPTRAPARRCSSRLEQIMAMNSLLFKEHTEFRTFFHGMLRPFQVRLLPGRLGASWGRRRWFRQPVRVMHCRTQQHS
jgi:hypothetical protein